VDRSQIPRLYYIAAIGTLRSVMEQGILSHNRAAKFEHLSLANPDVNRIRAGKRVPNGMMLHNYANFYINVRNAMLYFLLDDYVDTMCVLGVDPAIIALDDVVVTDGNAAAGWVSFRPPAEGLPRLDRHLVFLRYWPHEDPVVEDRQRQGMQAEVLVPHVVPAEFIREAFVANATARQGVADTGLGLTCSINRDMFFNRG